MATFNAREFVRANAVSSKTAIRVHGMKMTLIGTVSSLTVAGLVSLVEEQTDDLKVSEKITIKLSDGKEKEIAETTTIRVETAVVLVQNDLSVPAEKKNTKKPSVA